MPDETTPPAGNSVSEAPSIDWDSPDNPYVKRFHDTQASFTQNQQRLRELELYETDPDAYFKLGQKHGVEFEFPNQDQGQQTGDPQTAQELAELKAWRDQVEGERQQERQAAGEELFHQDLDEWAQEEGVKLSTADHNAIFGLLMKSPDPTQESAARQIFEAHVAHKKSERDEIEQELREAMKRPRVPHTPGAGGAANTAVPDWSQMSRAEIDKYMAERAMSQQ